MGMSPCTVATILGTVLACAAALQITADKLLDDNLAPEVCQPACGRLDAVDWSTKCAWERCKNCGECVEKVAEVLDRYHVHHEDTRSCPKWCERRTDDWSVKCDFEDCQACGPCPVEKESATSTTTEQPTTPPASTTADGEQTGGQDGETSPNSQQPTSPPTDAEPSSQPTDATTDGEQGKGQQCPRWCERNRNPWVAKCEYDECKVCGPCPVPTLTPTPAPTDAPTDAPTPAPTELTETSPDDIVGQNCPRWCGRHPSPWSTKCTYEECKVCADCPAENETTASQGDEPSGDAPPGEPSVDAPVDDGEVLGRNCPRWCGRHPSPWSTKCTYQECSVCTDCPAENETSTSKGEEPTGQAPPGEPSVDAPLDDEEITGNNCPGWCGRHPSPWSTKCTYQECRVCTDCPAENETETPQGEEPTGEVPAEAPVVEAPSIQAPVDESQPGNDDKTGAGQNCPKFCQRHTADWSVKCGWEDCGVCEQCATSQGEEPVGELPAPEVTAPTDEAPVAQPQASEQVCPKACVPDEANAWAQKCGLELCKNCEPCLESFHEVQTCMTHNDCDRSQGLYCADPRSALVEVNTCFTGLCICIELLPGHPNIVKVGGNGSSDDAPAGDSQSSDNEDKGSGQTCPNWCQRNTNDWSEKCGYDDCAVCEPCSAKEEEEEPTGEAPAVEKPVGPDPETHHATAEAGDAGVSANSCPAVCVRNEAMDWPEKCGWDECRQCNPCVEELHNPHRCLTHTDCDRSKGLYCADPRSAAIEVNTCFTGLCICLKALHGLPPLVRVGR